MSLHLRLATPGNRPVVTALIARSARALSAPDYTPAQVEGALRGAFGVDSQLIVDGTYYVVLSTLGEIIACGGWSRRGTLFGSDARASRDDAPLDPRTEPARIRALFVAPEHARTGLGAVLLARCESEARRAGFSRVELMATLPGERLYAAYGYAAGEPVVHDLGGGVDITFVPMRKDFEALGANGEP